MSTNDFPIDPIKELSDRLHALEERFGSAVATLTRALERSCSDDASLHTLLEQRITDLELRIR